MPECSVCSKVFSLNKNLYHHLRVKHDVSPLLEGKIACPLNCGGKTRTHVQLRAHLTGHGQTLESEEHEFIDHESFEAWKKQVEGGGGFGYVRRISEKRLKKKGEAKTHYICHRSGVYRSESKGQRKLKKCGSNKIGTTCPSVMEVSRSLTDGKVKVIYWKTHIGHETGRPPRKVRRKKVEMIPFPVCAVIPAAGTGERVGSDVPKQYIPVHQKPIICYTVEAFLRLAYVKKVVVVAASDSLERMLSTLTQMGTLLGDKLMVTEGSGSRHQSIHSGLKALQTCCDVKPEVVVVHDGVRPFFPENLVTDVVLAAKQHGAAGLTCPLVSTVVSVDKKGFLGTALDRNKFRASEMPQAFKFDLLCKAYEECSADDLENGTECLHLMQKYAGIKAQLLPATSHLWKVTHHKDIHTAAATLKETQTVGIISNNSWPLLSGYLERLLSQTFKSVSESSRVDPNLVHLHEETNPYHVLDGLCSQKRRRSQLTTTVHVFVNKIDPTLNFLELQKNARKCAREIRALNLLVYFVLHGESDPAEPVEELAELVRSLLFDSNPNISGNVFLT